MICRLCAQGRSFFSEDNHQQHFEPFLPVYRMRVSSRHDDGFAAVQFIRFAVDGHLPTPSRQAASAPPDLRALISSPLSNEKSVTLSALFCASVLLTT